MHLFAAQPGGFTDDEGIVDLDQSPGNIVILSAADSALAALATSADALPSTFPTLRLANWMNVLKPAAFDLYRDKTLDHAKVVVVSMLGGASYWQYGFDQLIEWQAQGAGRTLILVPGDDTEDKALMQCSSVPFDEATRVWRYLRQGGALNNRQLLTFLAAHYFGQSYPWHEPQPLPHCMMYMPDSSLKHSQASLSDWQQRWRNTTPNLPSQIMPRDSGAVKGNTAKENTVDQGSAIHLKVCVVLFYRSHLQSANTGMFDQLIATLEREGLQPLPIAIASLKDAESLALVNALIDRTDAKLIINTTGFACNTVSSPDLASQPTDFISPFYRAIPVFQLVLSSSTQNDWQSYSQGLRARDIAMQVVLPEMDGRIITRAVSFKAEAFWSERCQIAVVCYTLHQERASFVAQLAARYIQLSFKPNSQKRLALILANYPTKDGRIGNGVGLDTPASTLNILQALADNNYPVGDLPADGTALIHALLGAVTNNPNTLHHLPCWQSISLENYQRHFARLPQANQKAIRERWGDPWQDPKCRNGRIMLAGIRLGETFVGIQPARGFNMDLAANYHDPDLIPPHSYLAFYFWMRFEYGVDAIVHVGKHGNLEWLPGKGSALSECCWSDIALGPTPHFYPFIVNDPGEGAQAKRRTQAVIIDHLMPPMTRAEVYGDLAELEGLVDEYYQAMGMDIRRETWLKEQILEHVKRTNILQELARSSQGANKTPHNNTGAASINPANTDEVLLNDIDSYLCDIKEAQIRHGLHILGMLPEADKLSDTLVALLRLPRGSAVTEQGILHNLAADMALLHKGQIFDPLQEPIEQWQGAQPPELKAVDSRPWRTTADTRERLELLAMQWIEQYIISGTIPTVFSQRFPKTAEQCAYAKTVIHMALQKSVVLEIQSLMRGLSGLFVEPGPSGAPTRGRLDTLPTGRNFYSVDSRSIPSPAAWAIGERSANALIERHLQEHGDYPKQLGLSVWGTATMRTGGDDIAQAFSLMGIKPLWAIGSHRVIDFEIVPTMLLNRPRVDVTLRVSGFFRDAFPNVMRLYDTAVQAIADYEEPGNGNTIRQNIRCRQRELLAQGIDEQTAKREASYRVFGSKPGAYGAGLQGLIDERCWESRDDLAEAYLNWGGYAYGADKDSQEGKQAKASFQYRLSHLETVVQNQDNREHDLLDSDDYYQFQGGMTNAIATFSGSEPVVYHNDHSNPSQPKIRLLKEELNRVIRSRVLNPKWIAGMQEHGYKGAFEMAASVDYLFAYDATTNLIDDYQYASVAEALVFDPANQAFMTQHNRAALEEMAERLLEAAQRGLWQEPGEYAGRLQNLLLDIDASQEC
ncbi:cobaltochelatase subunit CobN [Marinagarivorans algicola]|uniref:cobaltochelatase subunit CobN n=1 Tax=Marinagarivorans algicola TaxID=1513270 RepID=UPI0006B61B7F|nr:cobaltochelatase subunit CobN [Marinagarivorans algicola]